MIDEASVMYIRSARMKPRACTISVSNRDLGQRELLATSLLTHVSADQCLRLRYQGLATLISLLHTFKGNGPAIKFVVSHLSCSHAG